MESTSGVKFKTVADYFSVVSEPARGHLEILRKTIRQAAPQAEEVISYNMPAFKLNGVLVYFAAYKNHIGFYPTASPIKLFTNELANYKTSKGAIQFPLNKPIPTALVKKIVALRIKENSTKAKAKKSK